MTTYRYFYLKLTLFLSSLVLYTTSLASDTSVIVVNEKEGVKPVRNESLEDSYFLSPEDLQAQVISMSNFITQQLEASIEDGFNHTINNVKINASALGFPDLSSFRQIFAGFGENIKRDSVCSGCQVFLGVMSYQIKVHRASPSGLVNFATFTCSFFRLAEPEVCFGVLTRLGPSFHWIVQQRPHTKSSIMCGLLLQSVGCRIPHKAMLGSDFEWNVDSLRKPGHGILLGVPRPVVQVAISNDYRQPPTVKEGAQIMKIVHLADLHIDLDYEPGTSGVCDNDILCCQVRNGPPKGNETAAGFYGDNRRCDAPMKMLHFALEHLRTTHGSEIDMIYMTGDLVPHNIWYSTQEDNTHTIRSASSVIYDYFPNATVIPCLGNHEPHPVNFYSPTTRTFGSRQKNPIPEDIQTDWVYDVTYESWKQWIPPDQKELYLKSGNYAVEINPRFRVIVVNTNVCYGFNLWQLYDPQDPGSQLEWLQQQLELTKSTNKTAHIVGHVPPGHEDCFKTWSREFYKIVSKYRHVIRGQFYGHTHYDEFRILHDPVFKNDPMNVMWIGPSLTPYLIHNPGYRIYHMAIGNEYTYGDIIDHETWVYNLDQANEDYANNVSIPDGQSNHVNWFKLYQAAETYQIENLLPVNLRKFVDRMAKDRKTFDMFYRYYFKAVDPNHEEKESCDIVCQKRILCGIVRSYYDDDDGQVECETIQLAVDGIVLPIRVLEHRKRFIWL